MPASSPRSCITTSFSRNMLDFSNKQPGRMHHQPDNSSVCNSTAAGAALKKARVQGASSALSAFKVRKEKLGDRITALHQIVSPFGKALSSPYLSSASANTKQQPQLLNSSGSKKRGPPDQHQEGNDEVKKDLRSRGLCLVPVSFFLHVGTDTGADFWPPALHGAF
ncbi:hypothetical protein C4D60_Mb10t04840 [Musa balbisiana]|uniref:BHLH domain-containing protein n=1 Tax=Musa balbisiana TaxID=52838 RepID=A0A4S8IUP2_MUSBA|nr:hypothetical protein C4D60_Mb10t04840 [Musa balbisiana]